MTYVNFVTHAIEYYKLAAESDKNKDYPKAMENYMLSAEYFGKGIQYERNNKEKKRILEIKLTDILNRVEVINSFIKNEEKRASNSDSDSSSGPDDNRELSNNGGSSGTKKTSKENNKLRSALEGSIIKENPNVKWEDVAGLEHAKAALEEAVILPIKYPQLFTGNRKPWRGILLYGPPGTGKSFLAKAIASKVKCTFFSVSSSDLVSKWQGESERLVKMLFQMARESKPSIIFIDEVDSLCSARSDSENESTRRIKTEFLVQMQGVGNESDGILVLAATNIPWNLDTAVRRRFERRIYIPLPNERARKRIFEIQVGKTPCKLSNKEWEMLTLSTEGYSGSDISILVRNALMEPVRAIQVAKYFKMITGPLPHKGSQDKDKIKIVNDLVTPCSKDDPKAIKMSLSDLKEPEKLVPNPVVYDDFIKALVMTKPSVGKEDIKDHIIFTSKYGQDARNK